MLVRLRRKTDGERDHLLFFRVDEKTGRELRLGKYEIGRARWFLRTTKGWQVAQTAEVLELEQLEAVKGFVEEVAESLRPGAARRKPKKA